MKFPFTIIPPWLYCKKFGHNWSEFQKTTFPGNMVGLSRHCKRCGETQNG